MIFNGVRGILFYTNGTHQLIDSRNTQLDLQIADETIWFNSSLPLPFKWSIRQKCLDSSDSFWAPLSNPPEELKLKVLLLGDNW